MREAGWVGRMERVEGGHWRMGSLALFFLVVGEDGGGCCLGRVRSVVMRLRKVGRGRVGIEGKINSGEVG